MKYVGWVILFISTALTLALIFVVQDSTNDCDNPIKLAIVIVPTILLGVLGYFLVTKGAKNHGVSQNVLKLIFAVLVALQVGESVYIYRLSQTVQGDC